jgi:drug/metabolite transporter (DMT)-like permease
LGFFGFFLYPIFYFYGLHSSQPVEANIINYFWPLATLIFGFFLGVDKITLKKSASIIFGFLGVLVAASTIPILGGVRNNGLDWNLQNSYGSYILAGLGALSFGFYSALRTKFVQVNEAGRDKYSNLNVKARFIGFLWVSCLLHILFALIRLSGFGSQGAFVSYHFSLVGCIFIVFYSIFNFSLAYFLWSYVEKLPSFYTTTMAFLIPPISAIFLSLFNNLPFNSNSIFGLLLIVIGLSIYQDYQNYITPLMGFIITFDLFGVLRLSLPSKIPEINEVSISLMIVQVVVAVFSILASFILARTVQLYREELDLFVKIEDKLVRIAHLGNLDRELLTNIDSYMNYMIDNESKFDPFDLTDLVNFEKENRMHVKKIITSFKKISLSTNISQFNSEIDDLQEKVSRWKFIKGESLSVFEWIILGLLIFATVCLVFVSPGKNQMHNFATVALSSCLVLFMFAIRDYDLRRPANKSSFILIVQRISALAKLPPYLPYELISRTRITELLAETVRSKMHSKIRTNKNGSVVESEFNKTPAFYNTTNYILGFIILALVSYSILRRS